MRKLSRYKCQFSSKTNLTGQLGYFTEYVVAYNLKEVMRCLRSKGYHLGKDFVYWKLDFVNVY